MLTILLNTTELYASLNSNRLAKVNIKFGICDRLISKSYNFANTTNIKNFINKEVTKNMILNKIHHIAVICSDYERSKRFYTDVLGLKIKSEHYRRERNSWKADCWLGNTYYEK